MFKPQRILSDLNRLLDSAELSILYSTQNIYTEKNLFNLSFMSLPRNIQI